MRRLLLSLVLASIACTDSNAPRVQLRPGSFSLIGGAGQVDTVAQELKDMVALRVIATDGATPVPSHPISWTALDGGQVFATVVYSGTDGIARQRWTLGTGAGVQRLVARALEPETGAVLVDDTVTAIATPAAAARLWITYSGIAQTRVGDSLALELVFRDDYGNYGAPCGDGGGWDRLTWLSVDSSIAIPTGQTFIDSTSSVVDRYFGWVRGAGAGTTTIRATAVAGCVSLQPSAATTVDVIP